MAGQGTDPPTRRKGDRSPALCLTAEEVRHTRTALRNVARAYGGFPVLASVLGVPVGTLYNVGRDRPCGTLAIRIAKAGGMTVEDVLSGRLATAGGAR